MSLLTIPIGSICVEDRARKDFGDIAALAEAFKRLGVISPLLMQPLGDGRFRLLAGERRYRAAVMAGLPEVPANLIDRPLTPLEIKEYELEENLQRKDFEWAEEVALKEEIHLLKMQMAAADPTAPIWHKTDTAALLGESSMNLGRDLNLAAALKKMPELKKCATKAEAQKVLAKRAEEVVQAEIARRVEAMPAASLSDITSTYIVGDCEEALLDMAPNSVDFLELDPPWGVDYEEIRDSRHGDVVTDPTYRDWAPGEFVQRLRPILRNAFRILKTDRHAILWFGFRNLAVSRDLAREAGFDVAEVPALWVKPGGMPTINPNGFRVLHQAYEPFLLLRKGSPQCARMRANAFIYPAARSERFHPSEKPLALMEDILSTFVLPQQIVVVPFAGSGNTLIAAANLKIQAVGFDISEIYRNAFVTKVTTKAAETLAESALV